MYSIELASCLMIGNKEEKEEEKIIKSRLLGMNKNKETKTRIMFRKGEEIPDFKELIENFSLEEVLLLIEFEEEIARRGHFEPIFPKQSNINSYEDFFECPRHNNLLLWNYIRYGKSAYKDLIKPLLEKHLKRISKEIED